VKCKYTEIGIDVNKKKESQQEAGKCQAIWDAYGHSSGMYFYKLTTDDFTQTRIMTLVK
jgi:hypothetical protein